MSAVADTPRIELRLAQLVQDAVWTGARHVGVDAVDIDAFSHQLHRGGPRLVSRWFTPTEISFCAEDHDRLATTFAGKEAVAKTLGTGIRSGVRWRQIEIARRPEGAPFVRLFGTARRRASELGIDYIAISLCHERSMAMAVASAVPLSNAL